MEKGEIINLLRNSIQQEIIKDNTVNIKAEDLLISSGLIDSFSLVDLAIIVEKLFKVKIEDYELNSETFDSLDQLTDLVIDRQK